MWREQIRSVGAAKVAKAMGVTDMAISKYVRVKTNPHGKNLHKLCAVMRSFLSEEDFKAFLDSLSLEILGYPFPVKDKDISI